MAEYQNPPPFNPAHYLPDGSDINNYSAEKSADVGKNPKHVHINTVAGAAVAGGVVVGAVAGSTALGVAAAAGGAVMATRKGTGGHIARATGDAVVATCERAKDLNKKHHIVEKTKTATVGAFKGVKKMDEKHHISENIKKESKVALEKAKDFDQKHQVTKKAGNAIIKGANFITKKMKPKEASTK